MVKKTGGPRLLRPAAYLSPKEAGVMLGVGGRLVEPVTDAVLRAEVKAMLANAGR